MGKIAGIDFPPQCVAATRFAPSPNGRLHIGHAFSAMCAHDFARAFGGKFLLRIEDIDGTRSRKEHIDAIIEDMEWLGLKHDGPVIFQSQRVARYKEALDLLQARGLVYRCWCTRSDIAEALKHKPVRHGPDGPVYPGTCRGKTEGEGDYCWRLDMERALSLTGPFGWTDLVAGPQIADPALFGDVVLWRKDAPASYHLAATLDDAADGISHVVRGMDLFAYTAIHRLLQILLDLPEPTYWHHPLLLDEDGNKLAKSRLSQPLSEIRAKGISGIELVGELRQGKLPLGIGVSTS
ncbi:tRNA glutamyl-Q(34) synthetase GluQRS [Sphingorhabdus buctiana]|uniref:tRNA glutamyl-Q(34) synthetase GluQRS n=1 Tax=Sphingorhabdus buctiana TaxID=1508805 RepID=A0ABW4MGT4_9SPHN